MTARRKLGWVPPGYHVAELDQPVNTGSALELRTRFKSRARWRARAENRRLVTGGGPPPYRWEVVLADDGWWEVRAMQNVLVPDHEHRAIDARRRKWWDDLMDDVNAAGNGHNQRGRKR